MSFLIAIQEKKLIHTILCPYSNFHVIILINSVFDKLLQL